MSLGLVCASKRYGERVALDDVTLTLAAGEIVCLLGPSGCGKSTLLRVLGGLIDTDSGSVNGEPAACAMVFQEPRLLPWLTVVENLALALPYRQPGKHSAIGAALAQVQLSNAGELMPSALSGGMAQRVGIARALLQRPEILLMDEPFAALDAITRRDLQKMLRGLIDTIRSGCLFVTHDIHEALTVGDRILMMKSGRLVAEFSRSEEDNPAELIPKILAYL